MPTSRPGEYGSVLHAVSNVVNFGVQFLRRKSADVDAHGGQHRSALLAKSWMSALGEANIDRQVKQRQF